MSRILPTETELRFALSVVRSREYFRLCVEPVVEFERLRLSLRAVCPNEATFDQVFATCGIIAATPVPEANARLRKAIAYCARFGAQHWLDVGAAVGDEISPFLPIP